MVFEYYEHMIDYIVIEL